MPAEVIEYSVFLQRRAERARRAAPRGLTVWIPWWPFGWLTPVAVTLPFGDAK